MEKFQKKLRKYFQKLMKMTLINRWIVFEIDLVLCVAGYALAAYIQMRNANMSIPLPQLLSAGTVFLLSTVLWFYVFKPYRGLVRYSNLIEFWRLFVALLFSSAFLYSFIILQGLTFEYRFFFVQNVFLFNLVLLLLMRYCIVSMYNYTVNYSIVTQNKSLIYDIDSHSMALAQWLNKSSSAHYQVKGFISREKNAKIARIQDLPIHYLNGDDLNRFLRKNEINTIIFPDYKSVRNEQSFISSCIKMGVNVLVTPPFEGLDNNNQFNIRMKSIQFEDLLGRDEITIDMNRIEKQTHEKVVLITGAAGSIGSELIRQLAQFKPNLLLLFDTAETPLHILRLELEKDFPYLKFIPIIGDVRSETRLNYVFRKYRPQIVFHAAAYKHVPLMEENPCEAVLVNVLGAMNVSNFALKYNVDSFVMISTDKAVNPTNVMGASKRIAEIYVQSLAKASALKGAKTNFVTTRFGNVLGSSGSVIPYFKKQIEKGGPVTVTHPDIIRYFMTIPEACRLVLEAASFGSSGEIYVFDMGSPVKIADLARHMIELAGFVPDKEIKIEYIGLRPGEKLYEELLNDTEKTIPTEHEKITVATVRQYEFEQVETSIQTMIESANNVDIKKTVEEMKKIVPEFKSQNSPFTEMDE
ncbi:MAG: nucleoside-diphosphate sugar epimerase/dehydratase [Paludibacter sp.]|nr:nucleoside-diphosphate sugar epimerase/dehydratase [Paludibacter sp.]